MGMRKDRVNGGFRTMAKLDDAAGSGIPNRVDTDYAGQLPRAQQLALAYTPRALRPALACLLGFDRTLGQLLATGSEPVLAQMRLAWWRDMLGKPAGERPRGNPLLSDLGRHWGGEERALLALVDGWENLLGDAPLPRDDIAVFAQGRGAGFGGFARLAGQESHVAAADRAGQRWGLADFVGRASDAEERRRAASLFQISTGPAGGMPRSLRGLALLDGLAIRAMARGGGELLSDRASALAALRLGVFGR